MEAQPHKCYKTARRRLRRKGLEELDISNLQGLDDIAGRVSRCIVSEGFAKVDMKGGETKWGRDVMLFRRIDE